MRQNHRKKISIIGAGLIGGSLGMALRKKAGTRYFVTGIGRNTARLKTAKMAGALDAYTTDLKQGVADADIVVLCTPVHLIAPLIKRIRPFLKPGAVLSDAGSVKAPVLREVSKVLKGTRKSIAFIGAHPMAGSEQSGIKAAKAGLYEGAWVAVAAGPDKAGPAAKIREMWRNAGAKTVDMTASDHDRVVAVVSHLPHVMAFSLCSMAGKLGKSDGRTPKLAAGSFRDMTRVAASSASDWASICSANRAELSRAISLFIKELAAVKRKLAKTRALNNMFEKAGSARQKLLHN